MKCSLVEWQNTIKPLNELIVQASTIDGHDGQQPFPIGYSWQIHYFKDKVDEIQIGGHERLVLCAVNTETDSWRRPNGLNRKEIINTLLLNSILNSVVSPGVYFLNMPSYKFVISPEGNGADTHRTYEALLAGCIPICEENELIKKKYEGCPILWTKDYSEITREYLKEKYKVMIGEVYDFTSLFLKNHNEKLIKECGNYWMQKMVGENFY